jgi:7-cyano-7-deazaguanine synthase
MDSTTLLYELRASGHGILAIGFDYGQRHRKEVVAARILAMQAEISYTLVNLAELGRLIGSGSALVDRGIPVPDGHYASDSMKATVVPNRNMIMLAIATGYAITHKAEAVAYAAHAGDHTIYPDCREEFADHLGKAVALCDWNPIQLLRPFVGLTKAEIVTRGAQLGVPYEQTWSCYRGEQVHCGICGTCTERKEAFANSGVPDPTIYARGHHGEQAQC